MKKLLAMLLAAMLVLTSAAVLAEVAQTLPDAEDMFINREDYYGQVLHGYYNYECYVNETTTRTAKFYIPENTVYNQPTVFIMVPAGQDTWEFFVNSGWKAACDKYVFHTVLMETDESGEWGDIESEIAYLSALREDVSYRPFFVAFSANFYAIAYGNAADVLMKHAMANPNQWAATACIGATGIEDEFMAQMKAKESKETGIMVSEVPLPMFIVSEEKTEATDKLVEYWTAANNTEETVYSCSYADNVYMPKAWTMKESMDNEPVAKVYYTTAPVETYYEADKIDRIYADFMCNYIRYPGMGNGALRHTQDIYEAGFVKYEAKVPGGYAEDGSDLFNREWYVYVPSSVNPDEPAPVVFVMHGAGGTGDEIAGRTGWIKVAEDRGVILMCPTASHMISVRNVSNMTTSELFRCAWSQTRDYPYDVTPDDRIFVRYLYAWLLENYNIDTGRVYMTGQSSGGMMSNYAGYYMSDIFTACAPVSAYTAPSDVSECMTDRIPMLIIKGMKDSNGIGGKDGTAGQAVIDYWAERNGAVKRYADYTYGDNSNCSYVTGVYRNYIFANENNVPLLRAIEVIGKTHAYLPSEAYLIWDEFFSQYSKDAEGNLYWMGELVK